MDDETVGRYVDTVAQAVALPILPAHRQGVMDNVRMILAQSEALMALQLGDDEEMGPMFRP